MGCREFGEKLALERIQQDWGTQKEFGIMLGLCSTLLGEVHGPIPVETVNRWEKGHRYPDKWIAYCICRLLGLAPEDLDLDTVLTPAYMAIKDAAIPARYAADPASIASTLRRSLEHVGGLRQSAHSSESPVIADISTYFVQQRIVRLGSPTVDWERIAIILEGTRQVDAKVLEDLAAVSFSLFDFRANVETQTLLMLLATHIASLRRLHAITTRDEHRRELGMLIGQATIIAGQAWLGMCDFGSAMSAFQFAIDMADEMHEPWLRVGGLLSQSHMHGSLLLPALPWSPLRMARLMEDSRSLPTPDGDPQMTAWVYANRCSIRALLGNDNEAQRDLERAHQAQAQTRTPTGPMFCSPYQVLVHEAEVVLGGRPTPARARKAMDLLQPGVDHIGRAAVGYRTWFLTSYAAACAAAGELDLVATSLLEALQLAKGTQALLLINSAIRTATAALDRNRVHPGLQELADHVAAFRGYRSSITSELGGGETWIC